MIILLKISLSYLRDGKPTCSFVIESEAVLVPESNIEQVGNTESMSATNFNTKSEYQSTYKSTNEPESTSESASTAKPKSRVDGCDHSSRIVNRGC